MTKPSAPRPPGSPFDVGYGRPPQNTRFVKGQSGNPKGRPKKAKTPRPTESTQLRDQFLQVLNETVVAREGERTVKISKLDAVLRARIATAVKGNPIAQRDVRQFAMQCQAEQEAERKQELEFWTYYKDNYQRVVQSMQQKGEAVPDNWPHPEDVRISSKGTISFLDAMDEAGRRALQTVARWRDAYLLQAEWEHRQAPASAIRKYFGSTSLALLNGLTADFQLPTRLKLGTDGVCERLIDLAELSRSKLEKALDAQWGALGHPNWRMASHPSIGAVLQARNMPLDEWLSDVVDRPGASL